jgi:DNA-binding transcriptional LysR family regulator
MRTFAKVVETGSFTKAAQTLHISRTRATHLVQQLEARLQVSLLNRTTRKVSVTSAGALYFERVVQLLADLEDSERDLAQALASPSGRLRVDVPSPLASRVLVPALPSFYARYPDIQLDMGVGDKTVDLLDESMDCVVRGGQIQDQSLIAILWVCTKLCRWPMMAM